MTQRQPIRRRDNSSTATCGYMTFLLSNVFIVVYLVWALLPSHFIEHIDVHYTNYYPPRELAGHIPVYLSLLFVFIPILYMGLNMITCPRVDCIDGIWDTRSNECCVVEDDSIRKNDTVVRECTKECDNVAVDNTSHQNNSLPSICDEDVRLVNLRIRKKLSREGRKTKPTIRLIPALLAIAVVSRSLNAASFALPPALIFLPHNRRRSLPRRDTDGHPSASADADGCRGVTPINCHQQDQETEHLPAPMPSRNNMTWGNPPYLALLTEPDACISPQRVEETVRSIEQATMDGGVTLVVMRVAGDSNDATYTDNKWTLLETLAGLKHNKKGGFLLIVNDDVDIVARALAQNIAVDGVHVKEHNAHLIPSIRKRLENASTKQNNENCSNTVVGTSCHSNESAIASYQLSPRGPDYLFVGTCYLTQSHPEKTLENQLEGPTLPGRIKRELRQIFNTAANDGTASMDDAASTPQSPPPPIVFAIGGIDEENCHEPVVKFGADGVATIRTVMQASDPMQVVHLMKEAMRCDAD